MRCRCLRYGQVAHPRLDPGITALRVDFEYAVKASHYQKDALFQWKCAPGKAGSRTPCDHRYFPFTAYPQYGGYLIDPIRQHHQQRASAIHGQPGALEAAQALGLVQDIEIRIGLTQGGDEAFPVDFRQGTIDALVVQNIGCLRHDMTLRYSMQSLS